MTKAEIDEHYTGKPVGFQTRCGFIEKNLNASVAMILEENAEETIPGGDKCASAWSRNTLADSTNHYIYRFGLNAYLLGRLTEYHN